MDINYPPVGFHFKVEFQDLDKEGVDVRFQSVAGLSVDIQTESFKEGGEHRFEHVLPVRTKYNNLVLKRGLVPKDSELAQWCMDTLTGNLENTLETKMITVHLLEASRKPLKSWSFNNAWPVKWSVSDLNSMNNEIAIETLEFAYSNFQAR